MSDPALRDLLLRRLEADTEPEDVWSALFLAALDGEPSVDLDKMPGSACKVNCLLGRA